MKIVYFSIQEIIYFNESSSAMDLRHHFFGPRARKRAEKFLERELRDRKESGNYRWIKPIEEVDGFKNEPGKYVLKGRHTGEVSLGVKENTIHLW